MAEIFSRWRFRARDANGQSTPMAFNPDAMMTTIYPAAAHPDCARMRTRSPMSASPNPASAPFPIAADPDESRIGSDWNHFDLRWWWRGVFNNDFGIWRRLSINRTVAINDLAFHATGKKRQRGGDYCSFDQDGIFHIRDIRRNGGEIVSFFFQKILMSSRRRFFDGCNPFEKKNQRDARQRQQAEHIKIIHERPQMRLLVEQRIHGAVSLPRRRHGIGLIARAHFLRRRVVA